MTRLAELTALDVLGIPVYSAIRPLGRSLSSCQGKGFTGELAQLSAMGEAVEVWRMEQLSEEEAFESIEIINLFTQKSIPITQGYLSEISLDLRGTHSSFSKPRKNSNGVGSSWSKQEAMNHAIFELIERKSIESWRNLQPHLRINHLVDQRELHNTDSQISQLLDQLKASNVSLALWDITMPDSFPCFQAVIGDQNSDFFPQLSEGTACQANPLHAIQKALLEAIQSRLTIISGSRDDLPLSFYNQYVGNNVKRQEVPLGRHFPSLSPSVHNPISFLQSFCLSQGYSLDCMNCLILTQGCSDYTTIKLDHPYFLTPSRELL